MLLTDFHSVRPPYETTQEKTLEWLIEAHLEAEKTKGLPLSEAELFQEAIREKFFRVGCKPDRIGKRGHIVKDYLHKNWEEMEIYTLKKSASGENLKVRSEHFAKAVEEVFEKYYPKGAFPPSDLIHVSCTGYVAPSGAQRIVSKRGWGQTTTVTHAYHMGCYGSIPATRIGMGFLKLGKPQVDIVHTEVCSLHTNPSLHALDQLVSQSLFADGFIKYSLLNETKDPSFQVLAVLEEIIPSSIEAMTWNVVDWGFEMTLSKEVPVYIARALKIYLERLGSLNGQSLESLTKEAIFAIHPGGPKILLYIQELLGLNEWQLSHSFKVLYDFGNMSSATLPHIWQQVLKDDKIKGGQKLVSLAFGPGLSISGNLLEKRCGN